jgi:AAA family ATP:ADP antiporter
MVEIEPRRKSFVERALSIFSDVRPGEGGTVLLLFLNALNLMALYYILKPVREALILSQAGAEVKSYASAAQAILFIFAVPAYGAFAARVNRVWLLSGMTLFFISNLALFILAGQAGLEVGVAFYIWLGVFNFMIVSQFWAFANDIYTEEAGKRLFPVVGIGISLGALVGARATGVLIRDTGPYQLMTAAAILLGFFILLIVVVDRREARVSAESAQVAAQKLTAEGGFKLVLQNRYLLLIALLVLLLNMVNTVGEFVLGKLVIGSAIAEFGAGEASEQQRGAFIGAFYGDFYFWVNLIGFLVQTFLVSRFIKLLGVRGSLFTLPIISAITYALAAFAPVLRVVRAVKVAENSTDYSLNNTVRQALFLRTSREAKYKAKAAIDTFFGRTGDALQAAVVFIGTQLAFGVQAFALVNLIFVALWLLVCAGIAREHRRLNADADTLAR